jgi:hypothetical protein
MLSIIFLGLCLACGLMGVYILVVTQIEMRRTN